MFFQSYQHCGSVRFCVNCCHDFTDSCLFLQIILFTTDEDILEEVAKNDFTFEYDIVEEEEMLMQSVERDRPKTADQGGMTVNTLPYKSLSICMTDDILSEEAFAERNCCDLVKTFAN